ncbi:MAG: hypothetical protein HC896_02510 [Bacteroidales bacterium]|nr:hypothetical protein [Bacteroidales bacterium]
MPAHFFRFDGGKGLFFAFSAFFAFLVGETFAPGYVTRFCVGKNVKETKWGVAGAGFFLSLTFPVILFFIALYARINFPGIDSEQALPKTILKLNSPIVGGVIIAALMSAVMSSADSILNSATAIFVKDIVEHYKLKPKRTCFTGLRLARAFSVFLGLTGILLALAMPNIIHLLLLTYTLWAPGILVPVVAGIFSKHRSQAHNNLVFVSMLAALSSTFGLMQLENEIFRYPAVFGVAISAAVYFSGKPWLPKNHNI